MTTRLRQVVLAAADLDARVSELRIQLGLGMAYDDPGVAEFGLRNAVLPVGDQFVEVISPTRDGTTAGRFLERRGGDGGYMVLVQVADAERTRARADELGLRIVWQVDVPAGDEPAIKGTHLHPKDVGGAILSFDQPDPLPTWRWAGSGWQSHVRVGVVSGIDAVELEVDDPVSAAATWAGLLGATVDASAAGASVVRLDDGAVRFVRSPTPGRAAGMVAVDLRRSAGADQLATVIGGVRFQSA